MRSDNSMAKYESLENGRLCATFPFTGPQGNLNSIVFFLTLYSCKGSNVSLYICVDASL